MNIFDMICKDNLEGIKKWVDDPKTIKDVTNECELVYESNQTPLIFAIMRCNEDAATIFVKNEIHIHVQNIWNVTPLMYSANRLLKKLTILLIKKGADLNYKNDENKCAISLALLRDKNFDIVKILLDNGCCIHDGGGKLFHCVIKAKGRTIDILMYHAKLHKFLFVQSDKMRLLGKNRLLKFSQTYKFSFKE